MTHRNDELRGMKMEKLTIGTRVYNGGDMANVDHFGTITAIKESKWGNNYEITPDADSDRTKPYSVPFCAFSPVYKGHGGTRFVTEAAFVAFREERIAEMQKSYEAMIEKRAAMA